MVLVVIVAACAQERIETAPEIAAPETSEDTERVQPAQYDAAVAKLRDKGMDAKGFHYTFVHRVRDEFGNYITTDDYEVFILGNKVRKTYLEPRRLNAEVFYTDVYIDAQTVIVACTKTTMSLCTPSYKKAYPGDSAKEKLPFTMEDVLKKIPSEATIASSAVLDGRKTAIIAYVDSGKEYKVYVDEFYGLPLKQEVKQEENGKLVLMEESRFSLRDEVTSDDMMLPEGYEIQK